MSWIVEPLPHLTGYTIEHAEPGSFYLSRRNSLFHATTLDGPFSLWATVDAPLWKAAAARVRLAQRLLRFMVTNVVPLKNADLFVTFDRQVGIIRAGRYRSLKGLARPCRVLRSACALSTGGDVFFGEYVSNDARGEVSIYKYVPGADKVDRVFTFPPGAVRHVHGVYHDLFTDALLCLTGDREHECRILRSADGFRTVETLGAGDESWRAVSVLCDEGAYYYGTDAEFRANQLVAVDRERLTRRTLREVDGTVYYSKAVGNDLFFATTAEDAPSQTENAASLWHVDSAGSCRELARFAKDRWHKSLFMFGTIHFPCTNGFDDRLYFHVVGVDQDNHTFCVKRPASAAAGDNDGNRGVR